MESPTAGGRRDWAKSKSFSAGTSLRRGRVGFNDTDLHDEQHVCAAGHEDGLLVEPEGSPGSLLRGLRSLRSFGSRRTFHQMPLKEALNIQQYPFVKECSQPGDQPLESPSPRSRRHSSYDPARLLASREAMVSTEMIDAMKKSMGGNEPTGASSAQEILGAFASDSLPELTNTIVVSDKLPAGMERAVWSIKDYEILRSVHKG